MKNPMSAATGAAPVSVPEGPAVATPADKVAAFLRDAEGAAREIVPDGRAVALARGGSRDAERSAALLRDSCPDLDAQSLAVLAPALAAGRMVEVDVRFRLPARLAAALWHGGGSVEYFLGEVVRSGMECDLNDSATGEWAEGVRRLFGVSPEDTGRLECSGVAIVG